MHTDEEHCFFYDKPQNQPATFSFKAAGFPCEMMISQAHPEVGVLANDLKRYLVSDPDGDLLTFWHGYESSSKQNLNRFEL